MKTCLFSLSYLDGVDKSDSSRLERNIKFLNYYWPLREELGFQKIILADNCSSVRHLARLVDSAPTAVRIFPASDFPAHRALEPANGNILVYRFEEHLSFGMSGFTADDPKSNLDYPYCWRGLDLVRDLFETLGYEKVIFVDSDGFILSPRLAHYLRGLTTGWTTVWCPKYAFPEASLQVITREGCEAFFARPWQGYVGCKMEDTLPFTHIEKLFITDRFGEDRTPVRLDMDYYGQAPVDIEMKFRGPA